MDASPGVGVPGRREIRPLSFELFATRSFMSSLSFVGVTAQPSFKSSPSSISSIQNPSYSVLDNKGYIKKVNELKFTNE